MSLQSIVGVNGFDLMDGVNGLIHILESIPLVVHAGQIARDCSVVNDLLLIDGMEAEPLGTLSFNSTFTSRNEKLYVGFLGWL